MTDEMKAKLFTELFGGSDKGRATKFPNEKLCIAHAIKIARLEPGDIVYVQKVSRPNCEAVFASHSTDKGRLNVYYYDDQKELGAMSVPASCITFEPVTEEEMPEPATVAGTIE